MNDITKKIEQKIKQIENNKYGYIDKPKKCKCGGIYEYYDGFLGYESLVCNKCGKDIKDK
jgi:hypothetical protein